MAYDLLIKNGRVIDGSGAPAFRGDVGVRRGRIAEIGKLRGTATRTIDAEGLVVAPGFIDNHCHYDAQVTGDPLCMYSCYHGATTVIIGNCSLALAPVRRGGEERLLEFLSYVEAIPMEVLKTVDMCWETIAEYMAHLDQRLGMNVGNLIGHTAVRHYVMAEESQGRAATAAEIEGMRGIVRDGITAGALGLSLTRNRSHYDPHGNLIPGVWADEEEIFALGDVLAELGTGVIQSGSGRDAELKNRLMSRLAETTGRPVVYGQLQQSQNKPDEWKKLMALVDESVSAGIRTHPMVNPHSHQQRFTMHNSQEFRCAPTWRPISLAPDEEKLRAYRDPEVRKKLHHEMVEWAVDMPGNSLPRDWYDIFRVNKTALSKNKHMEGKSLRELAETQSKGIIDAFLDLAVEEDLDTEFVRPAQNASKAITTKILTYPHACIGLSDGGAHVQFHAGVGYSSHLLGYWVREEGIMSLEQAVKRLTFESASAFGIYDRGLLHPGLAADITIFDPDTIDVLPEEKVYDFPNGGWRVRELATGIHCTIVNGQVLIEHGRHTGALPGRVIRNALYRERAQA